MKLSYEHADQGKEFRTEWRHYRTGLILQGINQSLQLLEASEWITHIVPNPLPRRQQVKKVLVYTLHGCVELIVSSGRTENPSDGWLKIFQDAERATKLVPHTKDCRDRLFGRIAPSGESAGNRT
jgi:hypothetical protein